MSFWSKIGAPPFKSYEEVLSSSWLAIRVATLTVGIIAFQSKKVIEAFSLYEGAIVWIHSILWTGVTAFAVLHFTVKLSKVSKHGDDNKKMRKQLSRLIILFSFIEFLLGVGYHILWFNRQNGVEIFTMPDITPAFIFTAFLDMLLPATLYFYGHTVHIKTKTEYEMLHPPTPEPTEELVPTPPLQEGDRIVVEVEGFGDKELTVKSLNPPKIDFNPDMDVKLTTGSSV